MLGHAQRLSRARSEHRASPPRTMRGAYRFDECGTTRQPEGRWVCRRAHELMRPRLLRARRALTAFALPALLAVAACSSAGPSGAGNLATGHPIEVALPPNASA